MRQLRARWLPILLAVLVVGGPIAWYKWPSTANAAEAVADGASEEGRLQGRRHDHRRAARAQVRADPGPELDAGADLPDQDHVDRPGRDGREGGRRDRRARSRAGRHAPRRASRSTSRRRRRSSPTRRSTRRSTSSQAREDVRTAEYGLEEKKIAKEQAQFEAPTIKRQAEIDYEKAQRALDQSKTDLDDEDEAGRAKMSVASAPTSAASRTISRWSRTCMAGFTIKAPSPGMVIYVREWNGKKKGVGSQWNTWDPTVATLPDLTQMESQTYVNEVDVRKLAVGQPVADRARRRSDEEARRARSPEIANVGEQRPNQDSKVFEVKIEVDEGRHDAASRHDDVERDRSRVGPERVVDSARGGVDRRRLLVRRTRRAAAAS